MYACVPSHWSGAEGPDVMAAPRSIYFLGERGFYLHALGVSAELWQSREFSLRNGEAKTNRAVCMQVEAEPQNRSLARGSQHSVPALTSPKTNTLKTHSPRPKGAHSENGKVRICAPLFSGPFSTNDGQLLSHGSHFGRSSARTELDVRQRAKLDGEAG